MVYARYVKKGKKRFGPYYYKNVRDKNGRVRNVYIGTKLPESECKKETSKPLAVKAVFIFAIIMAVFVLGLSYTSFFVAKESTYTQQISLIANENVSRAWAPDNPGDLKSFRISGSINANGTARVWLKAKGEAYLVFDSSRMELVNFTAEQSPVTGFQLLQEDNASNESAPVENITANETAAAGNLTGQPEQEIQNASAETMPAVENITENVTEPMNITGIANETVIAENATETQANETLNGTGQAKPVQTVYKFYESCIDTCALELSGKEYELVIEVGDGTVLNIDNAVYAVVQKKNNPPALMKDFPDFSVYPGESFTINLSEYFSDPDGDPLEFSFISEEQLTVSIDSGVATVATDPNFEGDSKLTFLATDMEDKTSGNEITVFIQRKNRLPEGKVPDQRTNASSLLRIDLSKYFSDPDGDVLSYQVLPNDNLVLGISGSELSISTSEQEGLFAVVLNVSDGRGFILSSFELEVFPKTPATLRKEKYFLSRVELIDNAYKPAITRCLFDQNNSPVYKEWSAVYYPSKSPYRFALVRVVFLNETTILNSECFIKEMESADDWNLTEADYGFSPKKFGKQIQEVIQ